MTGGILAELEAKEVLTSKKASDLRNYINLKSIHMTPERKAVIFTDAVNRIVDARLPRLGSAHTTCIKQWIFKTAVQRNAFSVSCADIFSAALHTKEAGDGFINEMAKWLEDVVERPVDGSTLTLFAAQVYQMMDELPESKLDDIILHADEALGFWKMSKPATQELKGPAADVPDIPPNQAAPAANTGHSENIIQKATESVGFFLLKRRITAVRAAALGTLIALLLLASVYRLTGSWLNTPVAAMEVNDSMEVMSETDGGSLDTDDSFYIEGIGRIEQMLDMTATAYDLSFESCGKTRDHPQYGITYSGKQATVGRTVAVDPTVIPIGSRLYIRFPEEYSHLDGYYVAEDTGRLIKGNKVDIFMGEDEPGELLVHKKAMKFGVREVTMYVLEEDAEGVDAQITMDEAAYP